MDLLSYLGNQFTHSNISYLASPQNQTHSKLENISILLLNSKMKPIQVFMIDTNEFLFFEIIYVENYYCSLKM